VRVARREATSLPGRRLLLVELMSSPTVLTGFYDYPLVAVSVFIAVVASYAALDLAGRVTTSRGNARLAWLCGGSVAMGTGIWSMHYVGMEAFHLPVPVLYDWPTVLVSLLAAILSSGLALFIVSRAAMGISRLVAGSLFMGMGIAAMHYIGMDAMRFPAMCVYNPWLVSLSVALAIAISFIALNLTFAFRHDLSAWDWPKVRSAIIMGLAIPTMHYVGMAAAKFIPSRSLNGNLAYAVSVSRFSVAGIAIVTLMVLGLAILTSMIDRRFSMQTQLLANSRMQLQTIFENMAEGIVVVDRELNIVQANETAVRLLDLSNGAYTVEDVLKTFEMLSPAGEVLPSDQLPSALAFRGEFAQSSKLRIRRRGTGETVVAEISTRPVSTDAGKIQEVMISYRDITEREERDEARSKLAAIVESCEDAIIGRDDRGIVTSWNSGAEKLFGYSATEMIGEPITKLMPPDREMEEDVILARIRAGETVKHFETVRRTRDRQLIHVSLTVSPIRDANGRIVGASKIARDITQTRQLEQQLHQSQKMEAIGQLTGGIAHDFNNLLGVVIGNLDLLERHVCNDQGALKRVQTAQKAAMRGAAMTRRMLAFSSKQQLNPSPTSLNESIYNTIELVARVLGPEINIRTHCESLPPVLVDASRLESVLINLVVNARDAMPNGGDLTIQTYLRNLDVTYPPVQIGELKAGNFACISVSDTGTGMSRETLGHAFEPFFTTKPHGKGTGLGLATVYGFAKQSGGTARIYSEEGCGTSVSLYFPIAETGSQLSAPIIEDNLGVPSSAKVLVVDDEVDLLEIAVAYLQDMGYAAVQALDGNAALEIAEHEKDIDVLITDIIMPGGINGVELARRMRRGNPAIRVVYSSGFPADALTERNGTLVDGPLLHKPYQQKEFAAVVRRVVEGRKQEDSGRADPIS
jgi:PAS domain S-box-containing protein